MQKCHTRNQPVSGTDPFPFLKTPGWGIVACGIRLLALGVCLQSPTLRAADQTAAGYYTEPPVYNNRPQPGREYELGDIGVTGIKAHIKKGVTVAVEGAEPNTPADGKFNPGDIIVGVNGVLLKGKNPYVILGAALTEAEAADGVLKFDIKPDKDDTIKPVTIKIPVLGAYSQTFPLNCDKSKKIIQQAAEFYSSKDRLKGHTMCNALACLFLLSTGDERYVPRVKEYFSQFLKKRETWGALNREDDAKEVQGVGDNTWYNGYNGIACAEYYLRTGDRSVLPLLQYYCDDAKRRQYWGKGWGHWGYALNPAYEGAGGLMNPAGTQVLTTLLLGKECGVKVDEKTLLGALKFWYRFAGHGTIPTTDTRTWYILRNAGKDGATAAAMQIASHAQGDVSIYQQAKEYLSMSALTSWPAMDYEFEAFWHGLAGANVLDFDPKLYHLTNRRLAWWYDLSRHASGAFTPATLQVQTGDPVDSGISVALCYTAPLKTLRITGAPRSPYAKDFTLPEQLWGTEADKAFLSPKNNPDFSKYGEAEEIYIPYWQLHADLGSTDVSQLPLNTLLKDVRHARYEIRLAAAKALRANKHYDELEKLLREPDPRLRRAALDGINDNVMFCAQSALGPHALKTGEYTPAMTRAIARILSDPQESWFVVDAALLALNHAPIAAIKENITHILPWTSHDEWWLRESAFTALMGLEKDDDLFRQYLPMLIDMCVNEYYTNPRDHMNAMLLEAMQQKRSDSPAGKQIIAGFVRATLESKILPNVGPNRRSQEGAYNVVQAASTCSQQAPEASAELAATIAQGGRLEQLDTATLLRLVRHQDGYVAERYCGFYPALAALAPQPQQKLSDILYHDFRPEFIKRLKTVNQEDEKDLLETLVDITKLKKPIAGWQVIGQPAPAKRVWRYCAFDPAEKDRLKSLAEEHRFREVTLPAGLEQWYLPEFDDRQWKRGPSPIGVGEYKAWGEGLGWTVDNTHFVKNNSDWGAGEFLLMRTTFEVADLDYDYYSIKILANQGYHIYLNGHEIHTWIWMEFVPQYHRIMLTDAVKKYLNQGANTLAVYCNAQYEPDQQTGDYHAIGQMDLSLEGLKSADLKN